jgi:DNA-binding NarL/FixJ family response regulator
VKSAIAQRKPVTRLKAARKTRVLLVDDHPIVRQGLTQLINRQGDLEVCGEAEDAFAAEEAAAALKPDLAVVDISLKDKDGIDLIKILKARHPQLPILVFSMHEESTYAERALHAGASGYIMKQEGTENLVAAVRRILSGRIYLSEDMESRILQAAVRAGPAKPASLLERLSDRELQVFELTGQGLGTRQIAEKLFLSVKTVETYRAQIKRKMNLNTGMELIKLAIQWHEFKKPL